MKGSRLQIKIGVLAAAVGTLPVLMPGGTPAQTGAAAERHGQLRAVQNGD